MTVLHLFDTTPASNIRYIRHFGGKSFRLLSSASPYCKLVIFTAPLLLRTSFNDALTWKHNNLSLPIVKDCYCDVLPILNGIN